MVDDHRLFGEAIQLTLEGMGMDVVGVVTSPVTALQAVDEHEPEMVLIDVGLGDQAGIDVGAEILSARPHVKVVALTAIEDPDVIREAISVGFSGYLMKDTRADSFVGAIRDVIDGRIVVPEPTGRPAVVGAGGNGGPVNLLARQLTRRELQVLELLTQGATSAEIGRRLGVSTNTVRTHVQGILSKLQVHSRLEAAAVAVRDQLVKAGP